MDRKFNISEEKVNYYLEKFFGTNEKIVSFEEMIDIYRYWLGEVIDSDNDIIRENYFMLRIIVYCFRNFIKNICNSRDLDIKSLKSYVLDKYSVTSAKNANDNWNTEEIIFVLTYEINRSIEKEKLEDEYGEMIYDMFCNLYDIEIYCHNAFISKNKKLN